MVLIFTAEIGAASFLLCKLREKGYTLVLNTLSRGARTSTLNLTDCGRYYMLLSALMAFSTIGLVLQTG
jgi:hypothetical protein